MVQLRRPGVMTDFFATRTVPSLDGDFHVSPKRGCLRVARDVSEPRTTSSRQGRLPCSTATSLQRTHFLLRDQRHFFAASAIPCRHQQTSSRSARKFFSRDQSSDLSGKHGFLRDKRGFLRDKCGFLRDQRDQRRSRRVSRRRQGTPLRERSAIGARCGPVPGRYGVITSTMTR